MHNIAATAQQKPTRTPLLKASFACPQSHVSSIGSRVVSIACAAVPHGSPAPPTGASTCPMGLRFSGSWCSTAAVRSAVARTRVGVFSTPRGSAYADSKTSRVRAPPQPTKGTAPTGRGSRSFATPLHRADSRARAPPPRRAVPGRRPHRWIPSCPTLLIAFGTVRTRWSRAGSSVPMPTSGRRGHHPMREPRAYRLPARL